MEAEGGGGGGWRCILTVSSLYPHCILTVSSMYPSKERCLRRQRRRGRRKDEEEEEGLEREEMRKRRRKMRKNASITITNFQNAIQVYARMSSVSTT